MSATSMVMLPDWVSVPERVDELSASRVPPLIETLEASVPVSSNFMDPAETVIAPDKVLLDAMETGVVCPTERAVIVELLSTSKPKLFAEVLTLSTMIEFSRSLLSALLRASPPLTRLPPPLRVIVFAPRARPPVWLRVRVYP